MCFVNVMNNFNQNTRALTLNSNRNTIFIKNRLSWMKRWVQKYDMQNRKILRLIIYSKVPSLNCHKKINATQFVEIKRKRVLSSITIGFLFWKVNTYKSLKLPYIWINSSPLGWTSWKVAVAARPFPLTASVIHLFIDLITI